jgi:hypothetical protein
MGVCSLLLRSAPSFLELAKVDHEVGASKNTQPSPSQYLLRDGSQFWSHQKVQFYLATQKPK